MKYVCENTTANEGVTGKNESNPAAGESTLKTGAKDFISLDLLDVDLLFI